MTQALFRIVNDTVAQIPNGVSPALFDFLTQCFQKDPNQRPSAKKLRTHHWLTAPPEELDEASTVAAAAGARTSTSPTPQQPGSSDNRSGGGGGSKGGSSGASGGGGGGSSAALGGNLPDHILPAPATIHEIRQIQGGAGGGGGGGSAEASVSSATAVGSGSGGGGLPEGGPRRSTLGYGQSRESILSQQGGAPASAATMDGSIPMKPHTPPPPPPPLTHAAMGGGGQSSQSNINANHASSAGSPPSPRVGDRLSARSPRDPAGTNTLMSDISDISSLSYDGSERDHSMRGAGVQTMTRYGLIPEDGLGPGMEDDEQGQPLPLDVVRVARTLVQNGGSGGVSGGGGVYSPPGGGGGPPEFSILDRVAVAQQAGGRSRANSSGADGRMSGAGLERLSGHQGGSGMLGTAGSSAEFGDILAAFAERPYEANTYDGLLEGVQLPDLSKRLQWRLHTPWSTTAAGDASGGGGKGGGGGGEAEEDESLETLAEYVDPFLSIERAAAPKDFGDAAAEARKQNEVDRIKDLVRRLVEAHQWVVRERREASRSRGGAAAMDAMESASSNLLKCLSEPPEKAGSALLRAVVLMAVLVLGPLLISATSSLVMLSQARLRTFGMR